jgi:hypothetical protein
MDFGHLTGLLLGERDDPLTVCTLQSEIAAALGASAQRVTLSYATLQKQRRNHPDLRVEYYRVLPAALRMGAFYRDSPRTAVVFYTDVHEFAANFRIAIKATTRGDELYVLSFFKVRDSDLLAQIRKVKRLGYPCLQEHR